MCKNSVELHDHIFLQNSCIFVQKLTFPAKWHICKESRKMHRKKEKKLDLQGKTTPHGIVLKRRPSHTCQENPRIPASPVHSDPIPVRKYKPNYALDMRQAKGFFFNTQINCATSGPVGVRTLTGKVPSAVLDQLV